MSARETIFASIRRSLGVSGPDALRRATVNERLSRHPTGILPERGNLTGHALISLFKDMVIGSAATLEHVQSRKDVPSAIATYLRANNLPSRLRHGKDARFAQMDFNQTAIECLIGPSAGDDLVGLSYAFGGAAETGTLVLISGEDNPTTLNFLPDDHIIIVDAKDVAGHYEALWPRLRALAGDEPLPRSINMITGPSRSGDIEQKLLFGAHGPRRLHVVLVG